MQLQMYSILCTYNAPVHSLPDCHLIVLAKHMHELW